MSETGQTPLEQNTQPASSKVGRFVLLSIVVSAIGFLFYALSLNTPEYPDSPLVGQVAYDFTLPELKTNTPTSLANYRGDYIVLNFWASWCVSCKTEVAELERAWQQLGRDRTASVPGIQLLGVAIQDVREDALAFMEEYSQSFPSVYDASGEIAVQYGVIGLPETYIIGPDGSITQKFIGAVTFDMIAHALSEAGAT